MAAHSLLIHHGRQEVTFDLPFIGMPSPKLLNGSFSKHNNGWHNRPVVYGGIIGLGKFHVKKGPIPCYFLVNSVLSPPFCGVCSVKIFQPKFCNFFRLFSENHQKIDKFCKFCASRHLPTPDSVLFFLAKFCFICLKNRKCFKKNDILCYLFFHQMEHFLQVLHCTLNNWMNSVFFL